MSITEGFSYHTMTTLTRVQINLQQDSGSLLYTDAEDGVIFHIEPMGNSDMADMTPSSELHEDAAATMDLVKSFLRQHLLKNGESSNTIQPMMRVASIDRLLNAVTELHLRKDADHQANGCDDIEAAMQAIYKTLGTTISMLQQRKKALSVVSQLRADGKYDAEVE